MASTITSHGTTAVTVKCTSISTRKRAKIRTEQSSRRSGAMAPRGIQ
ncbi:hypothetical protein ACFPRL_26940 [Pseudoclavibacter helvolus]